ncbi:hypothetical protein GUJ93_ZPchr0004g38161 [Zizania palustris]|uniref:Uncharacterized protein n=1 Tax=Zizania palustris TaxID=103762 RepID=A0A8J5SQJ2_ZIZPA|nr:hypothetical protein GUJ93_ZPchr0004g38161 [Zizania palustris]
MESTRTASGIDHAATAAATASLPIPRYRLLAAGSVKPGPEPVTHPTPDPVQRPGAQSLSSKPFALTSSPEDWRSSRSPWRWDAGAVSQR